MDTVNNMVYFIFIFYRENTNRLLTKGYRGVKTGNTLSAGYCLASWYNRDGDDVIVIVLGCGSKEDRDYHTMRLTK
jgi:D-alanyl-D-alanine carboxypeptidase